MLSVANVRSASGAASYFAKDNYYASADADRSGIWVGKGSERLGLSGVVEPRAFEAILRGELPGGGRIGRDGAAHRAGTDLTFSLPKSWSLLALVGKDQRIVDAYREAVIETLQWAERNAAFMRVEKAGKEYQVQTDNLTVALFQHDTNRNQEPNLHFHAVVANMTQAKDGTWKALRNDRLWEFNTLLNAMTMARFRVEVEKLGYRIGDVGKHGNFEANGISREAVMAFSTRRQEVLEARRGGGLEAGVIATLATRSAKQHDVDRGALQSQWQDHAWGQGLDLEGMVRDARERSAAMAFVVQRRDLDRPSIAERGKVMVLELAERLGLKQGDPLVPARIHLRPAQEIAAAHAVASAVRHLSEREAAFKGTDLAKAALDFGLPTTMPLIEKRITQLADQGALSKGRGTMQGWLTTTDAAAQESRMLAEIGKGKGAAVPILPSDIAGAQLQASASFNFGMTLNAGQEAAGRMILASSNRIVAVQGVAGAGKSSLLRPTAQILSENGKQVIGLGVQNTLVRMLERETGIPSMTLHRFLGQYRKLLVSRPIFPMGRDLGFLPGTVGEKLGPWMQPIHDNIDLLTNLNLGKGSKLHTYAELLSSGTLEVEPLTYIRGRSLPSVFMIVDEAQNLTPHEVKTVLTRVGHGTKIIFTGDPYQIDHAYLDSVNNGLTYLVEKFKHEPLAAHVTLAKGERSPLAELAANIL